MKNNFAKVGDKKKTRKVFQFLISVTYGISAEEQRKIVKTFLKNIFNVDVEQVLTAVMNEYTDYRQTDDENKILNRDTLLSIFR